MKFQIVTDVGCDIPQSFYKDWDLVVARMPVTLRGKTTHPDSHEETQALYQALRQGETAVTAAISPEAWKETLTPILERGLDVLVLAFSSGLSATASCAEIACGELREHFPEREIRVVDSLCASMGQGLLVYYACKQRDAGRTLAETADWCDANKLHISHWFTVEDLKYLHRGGRVSKAAAVAGTLLNIKPILHTAEDGKLYAVSKVRGRKAAIAALAKKMCDSRLENEVVFISHGDCPEDAALLKEQISAKCGNVIMGEIGAVIGSHSGPGTLAIFFLDQER